MPDRLPLQDCHYKLFAWFAQRVDARWTVRQVCAAIRREKEISHA